MTDVELAAAYAGRAVLVTGGLGFIGSSLARRLVDIGARVTAVDALVEAHGANAFNLDGYTDRVRIEIADLRSEKMPDLVRGHEIIFNLAGQVSHIDSMRSPLADLDSNCGAQLALLEACRKSNRDAKIVYASSRHIYGVPQYLPLDEAHPIAPVDVNGIDKHAAESYHMLYGKVHGLRVCSLRLTNTYGPRMLVKHSRHTALGWLVRRAVEGAVIEIWGDGSQFRDYTYIDDVVGAFLRAGMIDAADGLCINVGGLRHVAHTELASILVELAGDATWRLVPFPDEQKRIDIGSAFSSRALAQRVLGWEPTVDLKAGLARTLDFYRANRRHYWT